MPYRQGITQRCETAPRRAVHHEAVHGHAGLTDTEHSMRSTEHGMHAEHGMRALGSSALGLVPVSAGGDHASGRLAATPPARRRMPPASVPSSRAAQLTAAFNAN